MRLCVCFGFLAFPFALCLASSIADHKKKSCRAAWSILDETFGRMSIKQMRVINPTVLSYKWKEGVLGEKGWERGFWRERECTEGSEWMPAAIQLWTEEVKKKKRNQEWAHIVEGQFRERFFFFGGGGERRGKRRSNSWIRPACGQRWMGRKNNGPTHPSLSFLCLSHSSFLLLSICGNGGGHSFKYQHCEKMSKSTCYLTLSP